ncbi:MAG: hypothetical protein H7Z42_17480, partial [Roseiflexaceae bacterium]|nr:hypothetical protein [Roseiflexaceae bacterium]
MQILQLDSFPIDQARDLTTVEQALGAWAAGRPYPWRLLAYSRRFDMQPVIAATQQRVRRLAPFAEAAAPLLRAIRDQHADARAHGQPAQALQSLDAPQRELLGDVVRAVPQFA